MADKVSDDEPPITDGARAKGRKGSRLPAMLQRQTVVPPPGYFKFNPTRKQKMQALGQAIRKRLNR